VSYVIGFFFDRTF